MRKKIELTFFFNTLHLFVPVFGRIEGKEPRPEIRWFGGGQGVFVDKPILSVDVFTNLYVYKKTPLKNCKGFFFKKK
jgi:hypothetical protein